MLVTRNERTRKDNGGPSKSKETGEVEEAKKVADMTIKRKSIYWPFLQESCRGHAKHEVVECAMYVVCLFAELHRMT